MAGVVLAYVESRGGKLRRAGFEAVRAASVLAGKIGSQVAALAIGDGLEGEAASLAGFGASKILVAPTAGASYSSARYARTIADTARANGAAAVILSASITGKELAPQVATALETGLIADVTGLDTDGGAVVGMRPVFAGKAVSTVKALSVPAVVTIRPKAFNAGESNGKTGTVENAALAAAKDNDPVVTAFTPSAGGKVELTEADMIVSGGRGMKGPENFPIIEELAKVLGAAVGASRSAVDAGWRPHSDQVGQTGKTVAPQLYVACGISGAIQHLAGMGASKVIVAINKDPEAPIFKVADYGVIGDLFKIVPVLTAALKKIKE